MESEQLNKYIDQESFIKKLKRISKDELEEIEW